MLTFANEPASRLFSRLTIRTKTFIASAVVLTCLVTMSVIAAVGSRQVARNLDELARSNLPARGAAVVVNNAVIAAHMRIFRYVSWASNGVNQKLLENLRAEIETDFSLIINSFNELAARPDLSAAVKPDLAALEEKLQKYERTVRDVLDVGWTDPPMATMMLGQTDDSFTEIEGNIRKILNTIVAQSYSIVEALSTASGREALSLTFGLVICFLLSLAAMAFVAKSVVKPITSIYPCDAETFGRRHRCAIGLSQAARRNRTDDRSNRDLSAQCARNPGDAAVPSPSGRTTGAQAPRRDGVARRGIRGLGQTDRRAAGRSCHRRSQ
jgi:hypothetical protein